MRPGATRQPSPIQLTVERAATAFEHLGAGLGPQPDGWPLASDIVTDPEAVRHLLEEVSQSYEMEDRQVAASFLILGYFWYLMTGALACYLLDHRVPNLSASAVALDLREGVAFLSPHCWALPEGPDVGHPDVTIVASRHELRDRLIDQIAQQHATPLFATLRSVAPYGVAAMRANYVDRLASAVLWLAEQLEDADLARREVPALVALADLKARTGILEIEHAGRSGVFLRRGGCCLNYRLPGNEKCDTCCLRPLDERLALLRLHLARDVHAS